MVAPLGWDEGCPWLRFANDNDRKVFNEKVMDTSGRSYNNGVNWFRLREVLEEQYNERIEEAAKKAAKEKLAKKQQEIVDGFEKGGVFEVTKMLIDALSAKGMIDMDERGSWSNVGVIKKAAEKDSNVTKLKVRFSSGEQFAEAFKCLVDVLGKDGNARLQPEGSYIDNYKELLTEEEKERLEAKEN